MNYLSLGAAVDMFIIVWSKPRRPTGARDRAALQDRRGQVQRVRPGVDSEVRHVSEEERSISTLYNRNIRTDSNTISFSYKTVKF